MQMQTCRKLKWSLAFHLVGEMQKRVNHLKVALKYHSSSLIGHHFKQLADCKSFFLQNNPDFSFPFQFWSADLQRRMHIIKYPSKVDGTAQFYPLNRISSVKKLRRSVARSSGIPKEDLILVAHDTVALTDSSLALKNVNDEQPDNHPTFEVHERFSKKASERCRIIAYLRYSDGNTTTVSFEYIMTQDVSNLKKLIDTQHGMSPARQRILFEGNVLPDDGGELRNLVYGLQPLVLYVIQQPADPDSFVSITFKTYDTAYGDMSYRPPYGDIPYRDLVYGDMPYRDLVGGYGSYISYGDRNSLLISLDDTGNCLKRKIANLILGKHSGNIFHVSLKFNQEWIDGNATLRSHGIGRNSLVHVYDLYNPYANSAPSTY